MWWVEGLVDGFLLVALKGYFGFLYSFLLFTLGSFKELRVTLRIPFTWRPLGFKSLRVMLGAPKP